MPRSPHSGQLELPVRMGLATGEAELRDGDYFGAVLNRAARVMAAGHGGQILLADSTAGLLSGVDLLDLGPRRLRDLPTPVGVFQVRATGLRTEFPPLRALDTSPGNLRPATTSFIGRESEARRGASRGEGSSVGDVDRGRRGRQDPAGGGGRGAAGRRIPRRGLVFRAGRGRRSGGGARRGGRGAGHHPTTGQEREPRAWPPRWRAGCGCWCSTTASTCSTPPPI